MKGTRGRSGGVEPNPTAVGASRDRAPTRMLEGRRQDQKRQRPNNRTPRLALVLPTVRRRRKNGHVPRNHHHQPPGSVLLACTGGQLRTTVLNYCFVFILCGCEWLGDSEGSDSVAAHAALTGSSGIQAPWREHLGAWFPVKKAVSTSTPRMRPGSPSLEAEISKEEQGGWEGGG